MAIKLATRLWEVSLLERKLVCLIIAHACLRGILSRIIFRLFLVGLCVIAPQCNGGRVQSLMLD